MRARREQMIGCEGYLACARQCTCAQRCERKKTAPIEQRESEGRKRLLAFFSWRILALDAFFEAQTGKREETCQPTREKITLIDVSISTGSLFSL